jgi:Holliday junction resolvase
VKSKRKGKRGELEFAAVLRAEGLQAWRAQQFSGNPDSPDIVSNPLAWLHIEVKRVERLNLRDAVAQAEGDYGGKPWLVKRLRILWLQFRLTSPITAL